MPNEYKSLKMDSELKNFQKCLHVTIRAEKDNFSERKNCEGELQWMMLGGREGRRGGVQKAIDENKIFTTLPSFIDIWIFFLRYKRYLKDDFTFFQGQI